VAEPIDRQLEEFERELREQLQARPAPGGFADRVMARIQTPKPRPAWHLAWRWAAVAAVLAVSVIGGIEHEREQRIAGEHARQQVLLALRITGSTLHQVQQKVGQDAASNPGPSHHSTIDITP
jgi:hypothetical protein